jgi:hypothetical protein
MMMINDIAPDVVLACHFTGIYDVNRNNVLTANDFSLVKEWADSLCKNEVQGILFHNNFSDITIAAHENNWLRFVRVDHNPDFNPNVYRYAIYHQFIQAQQQQLRCIFLTDVSDVVMVSNPFMDPLFAAQPQHIFCGDEPTMLNNFWMQEHSAHFRQQVDDYEAYETEFAAEVLLNCGIVGGHLQMMEPFVKQLWHFHEKYNRNNPTAYTGDMGAFNYLLRSQYPTQICHGAPVNSLFKSYENERKDVWFRHK